MKAVLLPSNEMCSPRWARLCDLLGVDTPGERYQAHGHLWAWYQFWAKEPELDAGVWFRPSLNEIGRWADVGMSQECKWGRALLAAGYVGALKDVYPEPLGSARKGYCAMDAEGGVMLDSVFPLLRRRANAATLCLYLMDRKARGKWASVLRVDVATLESTAQVPAGWIEDGSAEEERQAGPEVRERGASVAGAAQRAAVVGFQAVPADGGGRRYGVDVVAQIREHKYADPLRALMVIDDSEVAVRCWRKAVAHDRERVCQELGAIVETDDRILRCRNPAAVLMANFRRAGLLD
jgi:hypothetical protein